MRKFEKIQAIKNVGSSWFALGINVAVGIFLSPFILHRLGDAAFGIWVLIFSITGYYGLFDLGIRSSVVRYVSRFAATNDRQEIAKLINTSLFSYTCVGIFAFLVTCVLAAYANRLFRIPPDLYGTARWLLLLVGTSVALGFPLGVFGGILEGLQRFDILNWTSIASTLARAALIVVFLKLGYGLLTVALITVALPVLTSLVRATAVKRLVPVPFGAGYVNLATLREMANYGSVTFMIIVAARLRFKTDEIVIGTFLSAAAITHFNIGARIVDYAGEVVTSLAQIFVPMSSQSDATGNVDRLRKIFVAGNRFCAFTILPICVLLIVLGKSVIEVWVGERYIAQSYPVLLILLIPSTFMLAQAASSRVLFGMGKHRIWAIVTLVEGVSNLILSILLVRPYGIIGEAVGTAIPLTCTMVFFLPMHLCRKLGIGIRIFLREAYTLPLICCLPMTAILLLMQRWFVPHNYLQLLMQMAAAGVAYGICIAWTIATKRALVVGRLGQPSKRAAEVAVVAVVAVVASGIETFPQDI